MGKRKRRLLFDVVFDEDERAGSAEGRGKNGDRSRGADGELRVTRSFAVVVALVFIVFVLLSYYVGSYHGERRSRDGDNLPVRGLERSSGGESDDPSGAFAVKARTERYSRFTFEELVAEFVDQKKFLLDRGFRHVEVWNDPGEDRDSGEVVLWVGATDDRESLRKVASELRRLVYRGTSPFETAFPARRPEQD